MSHAPYIEAWNARWAADAVADTAAAIAARSIAERLALHLIAACGARRVYLIGSLADGGWKRGSDIDLCVEGLPPAVLFRTGADLEGLAGGIPIDLVPLESATPAFQEQVARHGIVLATRSDPAL